MKILKKVSLLAMSVMLIIAASMTSFAADLKKETPEMPFSLYDDNSRDGITVFNYPGNAGITGIKVYCADYNTRHPYLDGYYYSILIFRQGSNGRM